MFGSVFVVLCEFGVILGRFGVGKSVWGVSRILSSMSQYCKVLVICFYAFCRDEKV